jgi:uncharacterized protein (TIGR03382 family)
MRRALGIVIPFLLTCGVAGQAHALGGVVAPEGIEARIEASRSIVEIGAESTTISTQIDLAGASPAKVMWLIPAPNVIDPLQNGVSFGAFDGAAFEGIEAATAPHFDGVCDGMPTGETARSRVGAEIWGPADGSACRVFMANEVQDGNLATHVEGQGYVLGDAMTGAIAEMVDANFMFFACNVDPLPEGGSPSVTITLPGDGTGAELGLRPTGASAAPTVDFGLFVYSGGSTATNFPSFDVDFSAVEFTAPTMTNYLMRFDETVAPASTRATVTEFSGAEPDGDAGNLTRLRMRLSAAALGATSTVELRAGGEMADNTHEITGSNCGGTGAGGAGGADPMGGAGGGDAPTGGAPGGEGGAGGMGLPADTDAGAGGDDGAADGDDDGGGGCAATGAGGTAPLFLALLLFTGLRRRRTALRNA